MDVWLLESGPWWRWFRGFDRLERAKEALLDALWRLPVPLFFLPEHPVEPELEPFLRPADGGAWRIDTANAPHDFYAAYPVSSLGNWCLYAAHAPLRMGVKLPDAFRGTALEVVEFMEEHRLAVWVSCFFDNTTWCVALREASRAGRSRAGDHAGGDAGDEQGHQ